ncbi:MAG: DUF1232 domain-containing protein [Alistipes sp.]|nr:DUF1232 domain-containing protein [Alistipes sp.]
MRKPTDIEKYQGNYSENKLLKKLSSVARWAGAKVVYAVLLLYYVLQNPNVSTKDKSKIWGALGYFILPTDLVLDLIPMVGYTDDLAALLIALHAVATNITPEIKAQAIAKLAVWFKVVDTKEIDKEISKK